MTIELIVGTSYEMTVADILAYSQDTTQDAYFDLASSSPLPDGLSLEMFNVYREDIGLSGTPSAPYEGVIEVYTYDAYGGPALFTEVPLVIVSADEPEEEPEDEDEDAYALWLEATAPRVAAFLGKPASERYIATAKNQLPIVAIFVAGYTRGRGFRQTETGDIPVRPLEAVIISACSRLVQNPEQVWSYTAGDYSERPAVLQGWTLAEISVLHRFRKRVG